MGVERCGEVTGVTRETNRDAHQLLHWLYTDGYSRREINALLESERKYYYVYILELRRAQTVCLKDGLVLLAHNYTHTLKIGRELSVQTRENALDFLSNGTENVCILNTYNMSL